MIDIRNIDKLKFKDAELEYKALEQAYYLKARYTEETFDDIREHEFIVPLYFTDYISAYKTYEMGDVLHLCNSFDWVDLGFGEQENVVCNTQVIQVKEQKEMSLDEIEKALGYRVKIVNKEE